MNQNKLHSKEISRNQWKLIVWTPIILGGLITSITYTIINLILIGMSPLKQGLLFSGLIGGSILIGWGFGLVYARYFKIKGIDN